MEKKQKQETAVILLSGGLDSATTLYVAKRYGYRPMSLIFDYRQRHYKEIDAAIKMARLNRIPYHRVNIALPWVHSSLTRPDIAVPFNRDTSRRVIPSTYVAARNIIFLSYAASFAESINARKIFIGAHVQDYSGYPDCRPEFLSAMERAVNMGVARQGIQIVAPLINKTKKEIVALGIELGVPFEHTWSCYMGQKVPCQKCDSCRFRMKAFKSLGMNDPLIARAARGAPQAIRKK